MGAPVANLALLPDLASALNNLDNSYSEAGSADRGEGSWDQAISEAAPQAAAFLLVARARTADAGHGAATTWLVRALAVDINDRDLVDVGHEQARRHRGADAADRYVALRQAAQREGIDAAYRPLLLTILAHEFAEAESAGQRALLAERRDDLLTDTVADALNELAEEEGEQAAAAERALALLDLTSAGDAEPVLEALSEPDQFPGVLHALALRPEAAPLRPAAVVAYTAAATAAEAGSAMFYAAVAMAAEGDLEQAVDLTQQARAADPAQVSSWINEAAEIGRHHPEVLRLIPALTAPASEPPQEEPDDDKPVALRVDTPEFALAGEQITVHVTPAERARQAIHLTVTSETGTPVETRRLRPSGETITIDGLAPGAYTIDVAGPDPASPYAPVSSDILIWAGQEPR